jgi:hypothetical protein
MSALSAWVYLLRAAMVKTIDHSSALEALNRAWNDRKSKAHPQARMQKLIEQILAEDDVTFKYILITGYLAKYVNPSIHARALQKSSKLRGAYDARSLCHKVVVGFEKTKGNLFGLSNEPFVNKPARHPEHYGTNPQLRNKILAQKLHDALEIANSAKTKDVYQGLVHILRVGSQHAADRKKTRVKRRVNLSAVLEFINEFLQETDGGSRLVATWGAIMALTSENGKISVTSPNTADEFGGTAGDVQIYYKGKLVAASECKHRPLNLDDVKHGIRKTLEKGVPEYHFVIAAGLAPGQEKQIKKELDKYSTEVDLLLVDIWHEKTLLAGILNPVRRARFGAMVVEMLRSMRKFESANQAAELWNRITDQASSRSVLLF